MENQPDFSALSLDSFEGVIAPANTQRFSGSRRFGSTVDPGGIANSLPVFIPPLKMEEDVIIMDAVPGPKFSRGGGHRKCRLPVTSPEPLVEIGGRLNPAIVGVGGGRAENLKSDRNKLCRTWEIYGNCKFGSTCQFAHGKEQLRPPRLSRKAKLEILESIKFFDFEGSSASAYGTNSSPTIQVKPSAVEEAEVFPLISTPAGTTLPTSPLELKQLPQKSILSSTNPETAIPKANWSPLDDGIDCSLPSVSTEVKNPSREDVDAYIDKVLYGTGKRSASRFL